MRRNRLLQAAAAPIAADVSGGRRRGFNGRPKAREAGVLRSALQGALAYFDLGVVPKLFVKAIQADATLRSFRGTVVKDNNGRAGITTVSPGLGGFAVGKGQQALSISALWHREI